MNKTLSPRGGAESATLVASGSGDSPGAPSNASWPVLDPQALAHVCELDPTGRNRLLERVLQAFEASSVRLRPQLEAAHAAGDRAGMRFVAHTLKSSSASVGALGLSQVCSEFEAAIRLNTEDDLQSQFSAMTSALDAALQAIAQILRELE